MFHFFGRALLKLLFPFKKEGQVSPEQEADLRNKYGFGTLLKIIFAALLVVSFSVSFVEGILNSIQSWFTPTEKDDCLYFYAHQEQFHSMLALGLTFFLIRQVMKWWWKERYEEVKLFLCVYTEINVIRFLRVTFTLVFMLGLLLKFTNSEEEIRFCNDSITAINKSNDAKGELMKGEYTFKYDSIAAIEYTKRYHINKKGETKNYTPNIQVVFNNDQSLTIEGYGWDASKERFNPKIVERLLSKSHLQMDTVEVEE